MRWWSVALTLLAACGGPSIGQPIAVVPGSGLPAGVRVDRSNNNLDVVEHEGRVYLAFRTAPSHFASSSARLHVISSADEQTWRHETTIELGTDLREPRLLSWQGTLHLYFAKLGTNPTSFEPGGMLHTARAPDGTWSAPEPMYVSGFIPWRVKVLDGRPLMIGYAGGENIYSGTTATIAVHLLTSSDGVSWQGLRPGREVVAVGGGSETDVALDAAGDLYAVQRNEAGDETGFGSKVCRAPKDDLTSWSCRADKRKFDSPLLFRNGDDILLVARRNVTGDGHYDLGDSPFVPLLARRAHYEADYSGRRKRCTLWRVDRATLEVDELADLPSKGDTCFPSALPRGEGRWTIYNYSSPLDDDSDPTWIEGQLGETLIYRVPVGL